MPTGVVDTARDEHKWNKAKSIASKSGHKNDYAYVMGVYKKMKPDHTFKTASERDWAGITRALVHSTAHSPDIVKLACEEELEKIAVVGKLIGWGARQAGKTFAGAGRAGKAVAAVPGRVAGAVGRKGQEISRAAGRQYQNLLERVQHADTAVAAVGAKAKRGWRAGVEGVSPEELIRREALAGRAVAKKKPGQGYGSPIGGRKSKHVGTSKGRRPSKAALEMQKNPKKPAVDTRSSTGTTKKQRMRTQDMIIGGEPAPMPVLNMTGRPSVPVQLGGAPRVLDQFGKPMARTTPKPVAPVRSPPPAVSPQHRVEAVGRPGQQPTTALTTTPPATAPVAPTPGTPSPGWYDSLSGGKKKALWGTVGGAGLLGAYGMGASSKPQGFRVTQA